jgi:hypothetical protein
MRTLFGQITLQKLGCVLDSIANLKNTADHAVVRPRVFVLFFSRYCIRTNKFIKE